MQLPQIKEREERFKLALKMALPIFTLVLILVFHTFITNPQKLDLYFYFELAIIFVVSIYFIFYMIYKGYDTKVIDDVSKVFTRDYLYRYLDKLLKTKDDYTFLLIGIDNLNDINIRYGIKSADKVLYEVGIWICQYLNSKDIKNFPIGHINGADFVVALKGISGEYRVILEMLCLKGDEFKIDDIEVKISAAINNTNLSRELNYIIENLFEQQEINRQTKLIQNSKDITDPSEIESTVINAIKTNSFVSLYQDVFDNDSISIKECFVKFQKPDGKIIHPKVYMKILDKHRLMVEFDLMVLESSIKKLYDSKEIKYAINISPTSIRNPLFLQKIRDIFSQNKDIWGRIIFILYEREYYSPVKKYNRYIQTLRQNGILIAIDRVGGSHVSFLYFRDLDIDMVRFDPYYLKELSKEKPKNILNGFIVMAKKSNIKTWIKMVESSDELDEIKDMDIDYVQGVYLSKLQKEE